MTTLVIHPLDKTTSFLTDIYEGKYWTVINTNVSNSALKRAISEHDRIIMMGHGDDYGLFGFDSYIIDSSLVYLLRQKECVAIWCNADAFFKKYELKGFYTGMIISEMDEAMLYAFHQTKPSQIQHSNTLFANAIKESISEKGFLDKAKELYVSDDNHIIHFNQTRMYITPNSEFI